MLLAVPVIIGIAGLFWSKGRITIKEFLALEGSCLLVVGLGFAIARWQATADTEIWSGVIVSKDKVRVSCSHSYPCNPHPCGEKGESTCWDTCYEHSYDYDWNLTTSNGEIITIDRIDRRGDREPPRWTSAYISEPTAQAHSYENYLKANPDSILRRTGAKDRFKNLIPPYPNTVYDYYRCDRFLTVGFADPHAKDWNWLLDRVNASLGKKKQVNIIILAVNTKDQSYVYALEEEWIGGKKNDLIVILGVTDFPKINWVNITSWSKSEDLKVELRDKIMEIGSMDRRNEIINAINDMADQKFVRRPMADFKYLMAGVQPGTMGTIILFTLGLLTSVGLTWYFYNADPFGERY